MREALEKKKKKRRIPAMAGERNPLECDRGSPKLFQRAPHSTSKESGIPMPSVAVSKDEQPRCHLAETLSARWGIRPTSKPQLILAHSCMVNSHLFCNGIIGGCALGLSVDAPIMLRWYHDVGTKPTSCLADQERRSGYKESPLTPEGQCSPPTPGWWAKSGGSTPCKRRHPLWLAEASPNPLGEH